MTIRNTFVAGGLAGALILAPAPAYAAKAPLALALSLPWDMHYAETSCMLLRRFGEGANELVLRLERTAPDPGFSLSLVGQPVDGHGALALGIAITFEPGGQTEERHGAPTGSVGEPKRPLLVFENTTLFGPRLPTSPQSLVVDTVREKAVDSLRIVLPRQTYRLELGSMGAPMASLRACTDALVKSWGLDPVVQANLRSPVAPLNDWRERLRPSDFPKRAARNGQSAIIRYRLMIDETGAITDLPCRRRQR